MVQVVAVVWWQQVSLRVRVVVVLQQVLAQDAIAQRQEQAQVVIAQDGWRVLTVLLLDRRAEEAFLS